MHEIGMLGEKGVTTAGKLTNYEILQPHLDALLKAHQEEIRLAASLGKRIASLVERRATHVTSSLRPNRRSRSLSALVKSTNGWVTTRTGLRTDTIFYGP